MDTISVYEAIGRNIGDILAQGQVASATGTSIDSTALIHPLSGQLKGNEFYVYQGAGAGQARTIVDFDPVNNRATFDPVFTTVPSTDSLFILFKHFQVQDYENAMNRAIGWVRLRYLSEKVATMELIATQYEYAVPSGFEYISTLRLVPSGNTDYSADDEVDRIFELPSRCWRIEPNANGSYVIAFDSRKINLSDVDEQWINVVGQVKPDFNGTQIAEELQEYIINGASMLLASQRIGEGKEWQAKFQIFNSINKSLEEYIHRPRYGKKVG
jgi:hypothetical protein